MTRQSDVGGVLLRERCTRPLICHVGLSGLHPGEVQANAKEEGSILKYRNGNPLAGFRLGSAKVTTEVICMGSL